VDCFKMSISPSPLNANMDMAKMFKDGWWIEYCCCYGTVLGHLSSEPLCAKDKRTFCCHEQSLLEWPVGAQRNIAPAITELDVQCCITQHMGIPPIEGAPICACFNQKIMGGAGEWKAPLFDWEMKWEDQFWCYYCCCAGCGLHAPNCSFDSAGKRPGFGKMGRFFCVTDQLKCAECCPKKPEGGSVWCSEVSTQLCCWKQCEFPPDMSQNPKIGICGWKLNKEAGGGGGSPSCFGYGSPNN